MPNRMDSVIAKGAGMMKGVKARLEGLVGVFKTLAEQHGEVAALLKRLQHGPDKRPELWPEIRRELLSHERGELREIYPVLRQYDETRAFAEHHDQEAADMETLIQRIDLITTDDWRPLFDQLVDTVLDHAREEEEQIFPKALDAIGHTAARELEPRFLAAKQQIATMA